MNILEPAMILLCLTVCIAGIRKILQARALVRTAK